MISRDAPDGLHGAFRRLDDHSPARRHLVRLAGPTGDRGVGEEGLQVIGELFTDGETLVRVLHPFRQTTRFLGGGLGVPYFEHERRLDLDRLRRGATRLAQEAAADPGLASARLVLEPGRFLVAEAGIYVARVTDVKVSRGRTFVVTDGGMHQHLAASGNLGQTIRRNFPVAVVNKLDQPGGEAVDVVGPLCTPLDVLARGIRLPPVAIGDLIGVFQSGAYARAASPLGFLSRPSPPEVMVAQGRDRLVRRRGRDEDHLADQVVPRDGAPGA